MKSRLVMALLLGALSCAQVTHAAEPVLDDQISDFIRRIHQDARGHYWFGTNGDGVVRYDGRELKSFQRQEGFGGAAVRGILEDEAGDLWFATSGGVSVFDGHSFTSYGPDDGLPHHDVWSLLLDSHGTIWVGTLEGVCTFEEGRFVPFDLPSTVADPTRGIAGPDLARCIYEDSRGRIWFGTDGGAFVLEDGELRRVSVADRLSSPGVNDIQEDGEGNIWFATHHDGVCRWDGHRFTRFGPEDGVLGEEVWDLFRDSAGNIWFPVERHGLYRHDGEGFTQYFRDEGLASPAVQCTYEDAAGRLWAGGYLGLYRLEGDAFVNVTADGPWPEPSAPE